MAGRTEEVLKRAEALLAKLAIDEITPKTLAAAGQRELLSVHLRLHQLHSLNFAGTDKTTSGGLNREELVNAEIFVQQEFDRRGIEHDVDDELTREADELRARAEKRALAPVHGSGVELGDEIELDEVLSHFKSFKLRMPFLYLVGGLPNRGKTKGDIDLLVKGPIDENLRRVIEFRLGRMLPPGMSERVQMLEDDLGGPFSDHVELADLVVEMRPRFERKEMSAAVDKQADPLMALPKHAGKRDAALQSHFRGKSNHNDLRMDVGPDLIGLTLMTQKMGRIKEPVETLAEARRIDRTWQVDGSFFYKSMLAPDGVRAEVKKRQPKTWLRLEDSVFEPGSVGATRFEEGVIVVTDKPKVEWGSQTREFHEWFFTEGKKLNGILMARKLDGQDGAFWRVIVSKEFLPSILKRRAIESGRMPPDGYSWIPKSLEEVTPSEFRYWKAGGAEARRIRDALIESRFFTARNVRMIGGQFRRVEAEKTYFYVNKVDQEDLREQLADLEHDRWSRWMKHMLSNMTEENLVRWLKQMETPYSELSEAEKDSDRREADNTLEILRRNETIDTQDEGSTEKSHSCSVCMECKAAPEVACVWADGRARAWFCRGCFQKWKSEEPRDIVREWEVDGEVEKKTEAFDERRDLIERAVAAGLGEYGDLIKLSNKELEKLLAKADAKKRLHPECETPVEKKLTAAQQADYERETERIRENAKKPEAEKPHRFSAAKWTHPNGHPRCKVCGDEESMSGVCNAPDELEDAVNAAFNKLHDDHDVDDWDKDLRAARREVLSRDRWKKYRSGKAVEKAGRILKLKGMPAEELPDALEIVEEAEGFSIARDNPLAKKGEQRVAFGVVLEPEVTDAQGDIYSVAAVRGAAMRYKGGLGDMHRRGLKGVKLLGSYLAAKAFVIDGEPVKRGTWLMLFKVVDRALWRRIKAGDYTGLSIGGSAVTEAA